MAVSQGEPLVRRVLVYRARTARAFTEKPCLEKKKSCPPSLSPVLTLGLGPVFPVLAQHRLCCTTTHGGVIRLRCKGGEVNEPLLPFPAPSAGSTSVEECSGKGPHGNVLKEAAQDPTRN